MNSSEKNARIVCRTKSVDVTRVIPSRYAASVATVDLPVPVAPPTRTIRRQVQLVQLTEAANLAAASEPSASPSASRG